MATRRTIAPQPPVEESTQSIPVVQIRSNSSENEDTNNASAPVIPSKPAPRMIREKKEQGVKVRSPDNPAQQSVKRTTIPQPVKTMNTSPEKPIKQVPPKKTSKPVTKEQHSVQTKAKMTHSKKEIAKSAQKVRPAEKKREHLEDSPDMSSWPLLIVAAVLAIVIAGIVWATWDNSPAVPENISQNQKDYERFGYDPAKLQTFENIYAQMRQLDERYLTDLHKERLGKDMIQPKFISGYVDRVDALSGAVNASGANETDIMNKFIEARRRMLISQEYFQQALRYGTKGVVTQSFNCQDVPTVIKATELYNQSVEVGRLAIPRLDYVLAKSGEARTILGLNTQKMRWYVTTFGDIKRLVDTNVWLIDTLCIKRQYLNNTQNQDIEQAREDFEKNFPGAVVP